MLTPTATAPLSHLRVLEIGTLPAAAYCARLLADLGAEVVKLEPEGGDAGRGQPPVIDGDGAWFGFLNYGKTSLDAARLAELLPEADVCIDSRPHSERLAADARAPGLLHLDVSWFGRSGPYANYAGSDAACRALAGLVQLVGPAEGPPVAPPDHQAAIIGGLSGCIAVLAYALRTAPGRDAAGHAIELSVHEACIALAEYQAAEARIGGWSDRRLGINQFVPTFPLGIYRAKDDWIGVTMMTPTQWRDFCLLLGLNDLAAAPGLVLGYERMPHAAELEAAFRPKLLERTAQEWFELGLKHRLPILPVPDMAAVLANPVFRARGATVPIRFGDVVAIGPGAPFGMARTPTRHGGSVPAMQGGSGFSPRPALPPAVARAPALPLADIRVIDLTMGWAGPLATRNLADLGADVVKVEACQYPDWWRGIDDRPTIAGEMRHEKTGRFVVMNRNKRGITLDLTSPEGVAILRRLVAGADAMVENYSTGVLPKLGLAYSDLRQVNPSLVMASMSAFGGTGPWKDARAYGSTLEHGSGLPRLVGEPDAPPTMGHLAFGDAIGGLNASCALLAALLHRSRTGDGQHIDLSMVECMLPFTAIPMMVASVTGAVPERTGNRHPLHAPHNVFRCAGSDSWLHVAVMADAQWPGLCAGIARPDLACEPELRREAGRHAAQARLEQAIGAWTATLTPRDAMAALQAHGVAAAAVLAPNALHDDPHLAARGFWQWRKRPMVGRHPLASLAFREGGAPFPVRWPSPTLGQHNSEVLAELLGMTQAELDGLAERGVIGTMPAMARPRASSVPS